MGKPANLWEDLVAGPLHRVQEETRSFHESDRAGAIDWKVIIVLLSSAFLLTLREYPGQTSGAWLVVGGLEWIGLSSVGQALQDWLTDPVNRQRNELTYWALGSVLPFLVLPALLVRVVLREPLRD